MKAENKKRIYDAVSETPGISRVDIAKQCHFSKTTVSLLVDELIQEGYVVDGGLAENNAAVQGRKPSRLFLDQKTHCLIIVNWRKRYIQLSCVNITCKIEKMRTLSSEETADMQAYLASQILEFIETECRGFHVIAICLILPAVIDEAGNEVASAVLEEEKMQHIAQRLQSQLGNYPLKLFNDTACLAYAEKVFGSGDQYDDFVYINVNDGIGAAFVVNGRLLGGAGGMTTQFGHFSLGRDKGLCVCGGHGCLETRVGEQALQVRIAECNAQDSFAGYDPVLFRDVGALGNKGDEGALRVINALAEDIGYALGNLITILKVDRIVLGGFGCNLGDAFLQRVRQSIKHVGYQMFVQRTAIEYTSLDENALMGGAARYYIDNYLYFN